MTEKQKVDLLYNHISRSKVTATYEDVLNLYHLPRESRLKIYNQIREHLIDYSKRPVARLLRIKETL